MRGWEVSEWESGNRVDFFQGDGWSEGEGKEDVEDDVEESVEDEDKEGVEDEEDDNGEGMEDEKEKVAGEEDE